MSFSHSDGFLTITPIGGPNNGKTMRLRAVTKVSFDPGGKAAYLKGFAQVPFDIVRQAAEPKLDIDLDSALEANALIDRVGGIGGDWFVVSHVFKRGSARAAWEFGPCQLENGGGFDSEDAGVKSKLSIKLLDAKRDGKSIYQVPA